MNSKTIESAVRAVVDANGKVLKNFLFKVGCQAE